MSIVVCLFCGELEMPMRAVTYILIVHLAATLDSGKDTRRETFFATSAIHVV